MQEKLEDIRGERLESPLLFINAVLLDNNGKDITENYLKAEDENMSWSSSTYTIELFVLYIGIFIVLLVGVLFVRYFINQ